MHDKYNLSVSLHIIEINVLVIFLYNSVLLSHCNISVEFCSLINKFYFKVWVSLSISVVKIIQRSLCKLMYWFYLNTSGMIAKL